MWASEVDIPSDARPIKIINVCGFVLFISIFMVQ